MEKAISVCLFVLAPLLWGLGTDAFFERLRRWRAARRPQDEGADGGGGAS